MSNIKKLLGMVIIIFSFIYFNANYQNNIYAANNDDNSSVEVSMKPKANKYELDDNSGYNFENKEEITKFEYGKSSLGTFTINGNINDSSKFKEKQAYGVLNNVSFSYSYDGTMHDNPSENWNISVDSATSIQNYDLTGSIGEGAILIQTSIDGVFYDNAVNPVTDFFKEKKGRDNFYTTNGNDIAQGRFYRVIVAYETKMKTGTTGIWPFQKDVYEYKNNLEIYEFYLCRNDAIISLHNLSVDEDDLQYEGYTSETLKKGETLVDNSVTTKGFSIDKLGSSYLVSVSKNGEKAKYVDDGEKFTENGKYIVTTITKLGKTSTQTIYVFDGGNDKGFSVYFSEYLVHGNRVYRDESVPVFAKNSKIFLKATTDNVPFLYGQVNNLSNGENYTFNNNTRNEQKLLLKSGEYQAIFYSGNPNLLACSFYQYKFYFKVIDEDSAPYVNYYNLYNSQNLEDLSSKHYEVAYQMTSGGYIFVCFSLDSYKDAFNYAYEIEGRFIEKAEDGGLYYKSEKNPNKKEKYYDPIELTRVRNIYAKQNVEYSYFNATDKYTYRTLEKIEELEGLNLPDSVKVFPSKYEKEKLINRQPFINNFTFIKVADFDVVSVKAYCYRNGKTYDIEFDVPVSKQLNVTSKYKIIEENKYGDKKEYDVYFVLENQTKSQWEVIKDGNSETISLTIQDLESGIKEIYADSISVLSISNDFDSNAIVTIKAPEAYSFEIKCLLSELKDVEFYKKGKYEISFIDRLGNSYKLIVNISGKTRYYSLKENNKCYTELYNSIYLNDKEDIEEIKIDIGKLKELIDINIEKDRYTSNSYNVYLICLKEANDVYENANASQEEINEAAKKLQDAINNLIFSADKRDLKYELERYESLDKEKYTSLTISAYEEAYNYARVIYTDDNSSEDEISNAVLELQSKYYELVLRGIKTDLINALSNAKKIDCSKYTPKSIEELNLAFENGYVIYQNIDALQDDIDNAAIYINNKINSLVLRADFSELEELIQNIMHINTSLYNKSSIKELKEKYDYALIIYNDKNSSQTIINVAVVNLQISFEKLAKIGNVKGLKEKLNEIKEIKWFLYTSETITSLKEKYDYAIKLLNSDDICESDVNNAIKDLIDLKDKLNQRNDKVELYELLKDYAEIDLSNMSNKSAKHFQETYTDSYNTLTNLNSTETDVLKAIEELNYAKNNLKKNAIPTWLLMLIIIGSSIIILIIIAFAVLILKN